MRQNLLEDYILPLLVKCNLLPANLTFRRFDRLHGNTRTTNYIKNASVGQRWAFTFRFDRSHESIATSASNITISLLLLLLRRMCLQCSSFRPPPTELLYAHLNSLRVMHCRQILGGNRTVDFSAGRDREISTAFFKLFRPACPSSSGPAALNWRTKAYALR